MRTPCAYMGGKSKLAPVIVSAMLLDAGGDPAFYDLCCGSGAVSIELVKRGIQPSRITMIDVSPWGLFWKMIGAGEFDIARLKYYLDEIPAADIVAIKAHIEALAAQPAAGADMVYIWLILQAASFGGRQVSVAGEAFKHEGFADRSSSDPAKDYDFDNTSVRASLGKGRRHIMSPAPRGLLARVKALARGMRGVTGVWGRVEEYKDFGDGIVYIDPPYRGTKGYKVARFNVESFAAEARARAIYVSEGYPLSGDHYLLSEGGATQVNAKRKKDGHKEYLSVIRGNTEAPMNAYIIHNGASGRRRWYVTKDARPVGWGDRDQAHKFTDKAAAEACLEYVVKTGRRVAAEIEEIEIVDLAGGAPADTNPLERLKSGVREYFELPPDRQRLYKTWAEQQPKKRQSSESKQPGLFE